MFRQIMAGALVVLASGALHAEEYKVLADRAVNFDTIKTFRVDRVTITRTSGAKVKQANIDGLRAITRAQLLKEGLQESNEAPDVMVTVTAGVDASLHTRETQGMPYFDGNQWQILPQEEQETDPTGKPKEVKYGQGTLQIDLRKRDGNKVVWRALIEDVVQLPVSKELVTKVVSNAFEQYPPPPAE